MTEYQTTIQTTEKPQSRDWAAIRGELSVYLLTIVTAALAFIAWDDAQLRKEQIEVVKKVHVQLDSYAYVTRDALARLEGQPPRGTSRSASPVEPSNHSSE